MAVYMYMKTGLINDTEEGPHTLDDMARLLTERVINPSTLCTRSGDRAWRTVGDYTEINTRVVAIQQEAESVDRQRVEQQQLLQQQQLAAEQQRQVEQERHVEQQRLAEQQRVAAQHAQQAAAPNPASPNQAGPASPLAKEQINVAEAQRPRRRAGLFDIFFTRFVTPTAVSALWVLAIVGYIGGFLFLMISTFIGSFAVFASSEESGAAAGGVTLLLGIAYLAAYLIVGGLYLLIYRVMLECVMVIFRCSQSLDMLAGREAPFRLH